MNYDLSAFALQYADRIGEIQVDDGRFVKRKRSNIGQALITGIESYGELNLFKALGVEKSLSWTAFGNLAFIKSKYTASRIPGVEGREVEFIPEINLKAGSSVGFKGFKSSVQYSYLSDQFTDATNAITPDATGIIGIIPTLYVWDLSASYEYRRMKFEASANNLTNNMYFTRRATGYPGPGILPSDGRSLYITIQVKF